MDSLEFSEVADLLLNAEYFNYFILTIKSRSTEGFHKNSEKFIIVKFESILLISFDKHKKGVFFDNTQK